MEHFAVLYSPFLYDVGNTDVTSLYLYHINIHEFDAGEMAKTRINIGFIVQAQCIRRLEFHRGGVGGLPAHGYLQRAAASPHNMSEHCHRLAVIDKPNDLNTQRAQWCYYFRSRSARMSCLG